MGSEPLGMWLYRAFGMPWKPDDINAQLKTITQAEYLALVAAGFRGGAFPRWNGSLYYPVKVPDLIGIKDRRYIDHTGTHLNRRTGAYAIRGFGEFRGNNRIRSSSDAQRGFETPGGKIVG